MNTSAIIKQAREFAEAAKRMAEQAIDAGESSIWHEAAVSANRAATREQKKIDDAMRKAYGDSTD